MNKKAKNNFEKRFGNRISIIYPEKKLDNIQLREQNRKIFKAFKEVLAGILKREPTNDELFGVVDIFKKKS